MKDCGFGSSVADPEDLPRRDSSFAVADISHSLPHTFPLSSLLQGLGLPRQFDCGGPDQSCIVSELDTRETVVDQIA